MPNDKRNISRRAVVGGIAAAPAVMASETAIAAGHGAARHGRNLRHQVFFWLNNPESVEDRDQLIAGLRSLSAIEVIRELHVGVPADTEARDEVDGSFAVSELMLFDDRDAQLEYQQHPLHQQFVEQHEHLWSRVVVYDSMDV